MCYYLAHLEPGLVKSWPGQAHAHTSANLRGKFIFTQKNEHLNIHQHEKQNLELQKPVCKVYIAFLVWPMSYLILLQGRRLWPILRPTTTGVIKMYLRDMVHASSASRNNVSCIYQHQLMSTDNKTTAMQLSLCNMKPKYLKIFTKFSSWVNQPGYICQSTNQKQYLQ